MADGHLLCPRWAVVYKGGRSGWLGHENRSGGRSGCYGRISLEDVQPTVVGRAEPHNLCLVHPTENRVLTIRENARCQVCPA